MPLYLPKKNIETEIIQTSPSPSLPLFVVLFGYMGAAVYVLKVTTAKIGAGNFQNSYIPHHIIRLLVGPAFAIIIYFVLITGGFFGLTIDFTKISEGLKIYVYAVMAFLTGYFVRQIIDTLSNILNAVLHEKTNGGVSDKNGGPTSSTNSDLTDSSSASTSDDLSDGSLSTSRS